MLNEIKIEKKKTNTLIEIVNFTHSSRISWVLQKLDLSNESSSTKQEVLHLHSCQAI